MVLFFQIGGSACRVTSSNETSITCTSPAHSPGSYDIDIAVEGKGQAVVNRTAVKFMFGLELTSISHVFG